MPKKMLALIKWVGGIDDGQYTVGIDTTWIKDFDYDEYKNDEEDPEKVYVIEWHDQKKEPLGGWLCYNGMIVAVSESIRVLEKKLTIFNGIQSPSKILNDDIDPEKQHENNDNEGKNRMRPLEKTDQGDDQSSARKKIHFNNSDVHEHESELANEDLTVVAKIPRKDNDVPIIDHKYDGIPKAFLQTFVTKADLREVLKEVMGGTGKKEESKSERQGSSTQDAGDKSGRKVLKSHSQGHNSKDDDAANPELKELGAPGSNVFITLQQWNAVLKAKHSFTAMTRGLLIAAFDRKTLLNSNYKGGKPEVKTVEDDVQYAALDPTIINAIKETVRNRFKNTFDEAKFGADINIELAALRSSVRVQKVKKQDEDKVKNQNVDQKEKSDEANDKSQDEEKENRDGEE